MAETITLRVYLNELSAKLEQGSSTAVISHCRYILQHYPQNVEAYRLLGRALLQKGQDEGLTEHLEEAAEVFQRVLSVLPNDHIAHLGMSEVRAAEEALDAAIWHLERAYEQMPGNQVLQEALRELYVKRDGEDRAPQKIHLTRSALARQYIAGQLYDQALTEIRTALEQDPGRVDLQVLLAETLWNSQHPIEAGEVAIQILKKLPNSLAANRILARLWLDNERPTDAQLFLERLEALDPYAAASVVRPGSDVADPNLLRRLDYSTEAQAVLSSETPDWVQQINVFDTSFGAESSLQAPPPDKDLAQPSRRAGAGVPADQPEPQIPPDWMSGPGSAFPTPVVPDWFVGESTEAAAETPGASVQSDWLSSQRPLGEGAVNEEALAPEIPDWFVQGAEVSAEAGGQAALQADWLADADETSGQGPVPSLDELMGVEAAGQSPIEADWLTDEENSAPSGLGDQEQLISEADWLTGAAEEEAPINLFEELERLESEGTAPEEPAQRLSSGFTDLLAGIETAQVPAETLEESANAEPVPPDWLGTVEGEVQSTDEAMHQAEAPASDLPDFETLFTSETPGFREQQAETEEDEAFWASFDAPVPELTEEAILGDAPEAGQMTAWVETEGPSAVEAGNEGTPTDIQRGVAPEWLPQTRPLTPPGGTPSEAEAESPASVGDWESNLLEVDSLWQESEAIPGELGAAMREAETETAPEEARPPADVEDWLSAGTPLDDASPLDVLTPVNEKSEAESEGQIEPVSELPEWMRDAAPIDTSPEAGAEMPEFPAVDVELMALFDAQDSGSATVESWESLERSEELPTSEKPEDAEQDWLRPAGADDDWLGAYAKFDEAEGFTQDVAPEEHLARDGELLGAAEAAREEIVIDGEAGGPDDWLTEVPDLEIEAVSAEDLSGDALSILPSDAIENVILEEETTVDELEALELSAVDSADEVVGAEADLQHEASATESPVEDYGVVQEDETPAWLAELEPIETSESGPMDELFQQPYDRLGGDSPDQAPQYASAGVTGILQPDEQPDWIRAFTDEEVPEAAELAGQTIDLSELGGFEESEETDSLVGEGSFVTESLADLGLESAAEFPSDDDDTEGFEPDQAAEAGDLPDWLLAITNSEADKLGDVFAEPEPYSSTAEDKGVLQPGSEPDWLVEIGDQVEEAEPTGVVASSAQLDAESGVTESLELEFSEEELATSEFEEAEPQADWLIEAYHEVAQPADLAHTNELEPVAESVSESEEGLEAEPIPDDFSFGDLQPIWLREPEESDLAPRTPGRQEEAPDVPEWLRGIFEDDESDE